MVFDSDRVENIVEKGEDAGYSICSFSHNVYAPLQRSWGVLLCSCRSVGLLIVWYTKPCPFDNLTQNRARITKFGTEIHLGM